MSHYSTPFIVINLGCEMVYVIEQRLKMQNIPLEKTEKVLTEIVTILLDPKLLEELFLPQPVAPHATIKQLIMDISASSIMKLDDYSMNKLWDLITMIFKWQIFVAKKQNIFDITRRHLKCVAALMPGSFPKLISKEALDRVETLLNKITDNDYKCLSNTLILWFSEYHTKISVLLRLGLQNKDGTFKLPSMTNLKFLKNLGENIYKYENTKKSIDDYEISCTDNNEIRCLLGPIEIVSPHKTDKGRCSETQVNEIRRPNFKDVVITCSSVVNSDITFTANMPRSTTDDLLDMLENNSSLN